jgi:hypothetical protein
MEATQQPAPQPQPQLQQPKAKKPIYKRVWFWVVAVLVLFYIIGKNAGEEDPKKVGSAANAPATEAVASPAASQAAADPEPSVEASAPVDPKPSVEAVAVEEEPPADTETVSQKNAVRKAKSYISFAGFSLKGLTEQLVFEGYSDADAKYGAENCGADWNEQAVIKAKSYLDMSGFSRSGLIEQLEFEGFTSAQAAHGADENGL